MPTDSWKRWELRVAKLFGCRRRGPDFRGEHGGKDDLTHDRYAVEVKLLARPTFGQLLDACRQAESAAAPLNAYRMVGDFVFNEVREVAPERQPIAIVKRKRDRDTDALVCMRLETWLKWHEAELQTKGCETVEPEALCHACKGTGWYETNTLRMPCFCLGWRQLPA